MVDEITSMDLGLINLTKYLPNHPDLYAGL
jgi:hypothetical protein